MPDDFDSVVADRFTVLDDVPVPDTWSRVQFKVLDRMPVPFTEEYATMIDLETPSPTDDRQKGSKRVLVAGLLAAAAVVVVVVIAVRSSNDPEVITPADTAVSSSTDLVVRPLDSPIECELEVCPWSPELTAQALELPIAATARPSAVCPTWRCRPMARWSPWTRRHGTLTWYEDEPRVVPLTAELRSRSPSLAIGPHDIAYIAIGDYYVAVAPSGAEITRVAGWTSQRPTPSYATATGLVTDTDSVAVAEHCAGHAVGRPRRKPDHRHQALPHSDGHRCRDRGPSRGTGMAPRRAGDSSDDPGPLTSPDPTAES